METVKGIEMNMRILKDTPPWDWPEGTATMFLNILRSGPTKGPDRLLAAELAGDFTVINDELVDALLAVLKSGEESDEVRARAAISLGAGLEHADTDGFENADDAPISEQTFKRIQR